MKAINGLYYYYDEYYCHWSILARVYGDMGSRCELCVKLFVIRVKDFREDTIKVMVLACFLQTWQAQRQKASTTKMKKSVGEKGKKIP